MGTKRREGKGADLQAVAILSSITKQHFLWLAKLDIAHGIYLGLRSSQCPQQRALAGIWQANQAHVRQYLHLQHKLSRFTWLQHVAEL